MKKVLFFIIFLGTLVLSLVLDDRISNFIVTIRVPFFDSFAAWITNYITVIAVFVVITSLFLWEEKKREWIMPMWLSLGITTLVCVILKSVILRARPFTALNLPLLQGVDYSFASWNTAFPSLHAAIVFSVLPIIDKEFPRIKWFWMILAILIPFSRLYVGVHYLSDILAGALLGSLISFIVIELEEKHKFFRKWKKN